MSRPRAGLLLALAAGALTGFWGLDWGLPGPARLRAFPMPMDAAAARLFADRWRALYEKIQESHSRLEAEPLSNVTGVELYAPGWSFPPDALISAFRSMLLQSDNPDEKKSFIILAQMRPHKLDFRPLYVFYGGGFIYPLGAFLKTLDVLGVVNVVPDVAHYLQNPGDMRALYLWGRVFVILFHVATLLALFDMAGGAKGRADAPWAAALFALSPIVVVNSHILKPHAYAAAWCLFGAALCARALDSGRARDYLGAGACFGAGAGAALPFAAFSWLPALVWALRRFKKGEWRWMLASGALAALVCLALNPYLAFAPKSFAWDFAQYIPKEGGGASGGGALLSLLWALGESMGPALFLAALAGCALALKDGEPRDRFMALSFLGLFAVLWLLFGRFYSFGVSTAGIRYYYPLFGLGAVCAAYALSRLRGPAKWLVAAALLLDTGARAVVYLENMRRGAGPSSTRYQAADWVEAHLPPGSSVGLVRHPEPAHTPPFRYDRYKLVIFERAEKLTPSQLPRYLVLDEEGLNSLGGWEKGRYRELKRFDPFSLGPLRPTDPGFYANVPVLILEKL